MLLQRELRQNFKGFVITTLICSLLSVYIIVLIPSMGSEMQTMLDIKMPKQLQLAFGMQGLDLSRPMGIYSIMFSYLYLTFAIYAATVFGHILAKEFADKTAEFLFAMPARRIDLIRTKLLVAAGYLTVSVSITVAATALTFLAVIGSDVNWGALWNMALAYWLGAMFFGAMAFWLSARFVRTRLAVGLVMGAYLLQVVISLNDNLDFVKYISPFDWFKGNAIVSSGHVEVSGLLIALLGTVACLVLGVRAYLRKDVLV